MNLMNEDYALTRAFLNESKEQKVIVSIRFE